jgi:hypothetical protein
VGTVRRWWQKLTGREPERPPVARQPRPPEKTPEASGLQLSDSPRQEAKSSKVAAAGFDPYASDAGYAKPHSWERVDHD